MKFVAHTSSRPPRSRKAGMIFSSSFVTPCSGRRRLAAALAGDLLDLVDEHDACSSSSISVNVSRRRAASRRRPRRGATGTPRRTASAGRDATALANVVLPGPGRPEAGRSRAAGLTPYSRRGPGSTSGRTIAPLDELLLVLHAGERLPQPAREHPAAELAEQPDLLRLQRHDALEVRQVARSRSRSCATP
jgi:hypothetical protein